MNRRRSRLANLAATIDRCSPARRNGDAREAQRTLWRDDGRTAMPDAPAAPAPHGSPASTFVPRSAPHPAPSDAAPAPRAASPAPSSQFSTSSVALTAPRGRTAAAPPISAGEVQAALESLSAAASATAAPEPPHFLARKDVERLPLHADEASDEPQSPSMAASSHAVFDQLKQQFSNAATFDLGRIDLAEHFSALERSIDPDPEPEPVAASALSAMELARELNALYGASDGETEAEDTPPASDQPWSAGPASSEPDQASDAPSFLAGPSDQPASPYTDEHHEEPVMASSILDLHRTADLRRQQMRRPPGAPAPAATANPLPSRAIGTAKSMGRRTAILPRSAAFGAIDYEVAGPFDIIRQPTSMICWATVFTMMLAWKRQESRPIEDSVAMIGKTWANKVKNNEGLRASEKPNFLNDAGLVARPPQSYPAAEWRSMLQSYGPLWVTTDEDPAANAFAIHARILYGMSGDGTPAGTTMHFIDPALGATSTETFGAFIEKYESEARAPGTPLRTVVVHWPAGARSMSAPSRRNGMDTRSFSGTPRGIRNNNPGNLRISKSSWDGKVPVEKNTDGAFEQFTTYAYGVRALIKLVRNYIRGGRNTARKIVAAYAPASDGNHVENYTRMIVQRLNDGGVSGDGNATLQPNRTTIRLICQAVGRMENGVEAISDAQFDEGFALLSGEDQASMAQSLAFGEADPYEGFGEEDGTLVQASARAWGYYRAFSTEDDVDDQEREDVGGATIPHMMAAELAAHCPVTLADDAATDHFKLSEFNSHDGVETPRAARGNVQHLMENLEVIRATVGKPMRIVSGYRSPQHNTNVGGAKKSRHLCGQAADIQIDGMTPGEVHSTIKQLMEDGSITAGGLGLYKTFVHYDTRGKYTPWGG